MNTAVDWCATFNRFEDADAIALSSYLERNNDQLATDVDTLDCMIDGAKASRHVDALKQNIDRWENQLTQMLSLDEDAGKRPAKLNGAFSRPLPITLVQHARTAIEGGGFN